MDIDFCNLITIRAKKVHFLLLVLLPLILLGERASCPSLFVLFMSLTIAKVSVTSLLGCLLLWMKGLSLLNHLDVASVSSLSCSSFLPPPCFQWCCVPKQHGDRFAHGF